MSNRSLAVEVNALAEQWRLCNAARKKDDEFCRRPKCRRCMRLRLWYGAGNRRAAA